jgi:hypothetical protein
MELGRVDGNGYKVTTSDTVITISAAGRYPTRGYKGWLEPQISTGGTREYYFYLEPPFPAQDPPGSLFRLRERFAFTPPSPVAVFVIDADGRHELPVPGEPTPSFLTHVTAERVESAILQMGAELSKLNISEGYTERSFRLGEEIVTVYSDSNFTDVEGSESLLKAVHRVIS